MVQAMRTGGYLRMALFFPSILLLGVTFSEISGAASPNSEQLSAQQILDATDVRGGLVVHVGCGDGKLTTALCAGDGYLVHGLDTEAKNVEQARRHVRSSSLYDHVSFDRFDGAQLPYVDNLVNLIVVDESATIDQDELMRALSPGGVAYVNKDGRWSKTVKPRPEEIDEWTHYLHDASGNAVAEDSVVGPPRRYQWIAGPRWGRSHDFLASLSALVSSGGRIFYIVDEAPLASVAIEPQWSLVARDAFSGVLLWERPVRPWEGHLRGFRSGPTELARRLVAVDDRVYVTLGYGKPVCALDAATGETIETYEETAGALEIICHEGTLLTVVGDRLPDNTTGAAMPEQPEKLWHWWSVFEETPPQKHLVAVDAESGDLLWKKDDADTAQMMPTTLAAAGKKAFFQSHKEVLAMEASSGNVLWRADRPVNRHRPSWSAPTLVVYGDIVLCGDRAVEAKLPDTPVSEKGSQWVVNSRGGVAPKGQMIAFSAATGEKLWTSDCRESYNSPPDLLVAQGMVWSGNLVTAREPGITTGRDVRTGEVARTRPKDQDFFRIIMGHHRCHRNKATEKYLILGRDGVELIDLATGEGFGNAWTRGTCQYGVMPCNGLIYVPPHSCACHVESLLNSFNALAPAGKPAKATDDDARLERGPDWARHIRQVEAPREQLPLHRGVVTDHDPTWPTYRHDAARSGHGSCDLPAELTQAWECKLPYGRISSPVVADDKVFVACVDAHLVCVLDATSGKLLWEFTAGGRVDSPPTIHEGTAIFGCADGSIYCLRTADGQMLWRFQAAPEDQRIVSYGQLESVWPLHGSVLVLNDEVQAVAGRSSYLDGGMVLYRLDAASGKMLSKTPITTAAKPDVLSSDGESVYLRHKRFDTKGVLQQSSAPHLYSPSGFLDDTWWHRTYWLIGTGRRSGWGSWPSTGNQVPSGRLLVLGESNVYGFGRFNQFHRDGAHVGLGRTRYLLYASPSVSEQAERRGKRSPAGAKVASRWSRPIPILARGMVLCGETLFVAGPPDTIGCAAEEATYQYHVASAKALQEQEAALAGRRGGLLLAVSATDGAKLKQYKLDAPPAWDGMAAAYGRLYLSQANGKVICMD